MLIWNMAPRAVTAVSRLWAASQRISSASGAATWTCQIASCSARSRAATTTPGKLASRRTSQIVSSQTIGGC